MKRITLLLLLNMGMHCFAENDVINIGEPISRLEYLKAFEKILVHHLSNLESWIYGTMQRDVDYPLTSKIAYEYFTAPVCLEYIGYAINHFFNIIDRYYYSQKWFVQDVAKGEIYSLFLDHLIPFEFTIPENKEASLSQLKNFLIRKYAANEQCVSTYLSLMSRKIIFTKILEKIKLEIDAHSSLWSRIVRFLGF